LIWTKKKILVEIWAKVIRFEQNQYPASPKTFDLMRLWFWMSWWLQKQKENSDSFT